MEKRCDVGRLQKENKLEKGINLQYEKKVLYIEKVLPQQHYPIYILMEITSEKNFLPLTQL